MINSTLTLVSKMDSVNFNELRTPETCNRKLNCTYRKSQSGYSFSKHTSRKEEKYYDGVSNNLKTLGITGTAWETYRVNALYDFSYEKCKCYEYQTILAKNVTEAIQKSEIDEYKEIIVKFEAFPELAVTKNDYPALKIKIDGVSINEEYTECLTALLLSIAREEGIKEKERLVEEAVILPLVLIECEHTIFLQSFIDFLEENFSCIVSPLKFSSNNLKWILTLFSSPGMGVHTISTVLEYEVPFEELSSIDYTIDAGSITKAWNKIMEPGMVEVTEDKKDEFLSILESYFYEMFHINLSLLQLNAVKTDEFNIKGDHFIRVNKGHKLYFLLKLLTKLAQDITT